MDADAVSAQAVAGAAVAAGGAIAREHARFARALRRSGRADARAFELIAEAALASSVRVRTRFTVGEQRSADLRVRARARSARALDVAFARGTVGELGHTVSRRFGPDAEPALAIGAFVALRAVGERAPADAGSSATGFRRSQ